MAQDCICLSFDIHILHISNLKPHPLEEGVAYIFERELTIFSQSSPLLHTNKCEIVGECENVSREFLYVCVSMFLQVSAGGILCLLINLLIFFYNQLICHLIFIVFVVMSECNSQQLYFFFFLFNWMIKLFLLIFHKLTIAYLWILIFWRHLHTYISTYIHG